MALVKKIWLTLRSLIAAFAGYMIIVAGTTLTGKLLGDVSFSKSQLWKPLLTGIGGIVSGLVGGFAAAWLGGRRPLLHALGVSVFLTIESTWLIAFSGLLREPIWFSILGAVTLMAAALTGGLLYRATVRRFGGGRAPGPAAGLPARARQA